MVRFPELPAGGDVSDLIEKGATKKELAQEFDWRWNGSRRTLRVETKRGAFASRTGGYERPIILVERGNSTVSLQRARKRSIKAKVDFYSRGGTLVRPAIDEVDASKGRKTKSARLLEVSRKDGRLSLPLYPLGAVRQEGEDHRAHRSAPAGRGDHPSQGRGVEASDAGRRYHIADHAT